MCALGALCPKTLRNYVVEQIRLAVPLFRSSSSAKTRPSIDSLPHSLINSEFHAVANNGITSRQSPATSPPWTTPPIRAQFEPKLRRQPVQQGRDLSPWNCRGSDITIVPCPFGLSPFASAALPLCGCPCPFSADCLIFREMLENEFSSCLPFGVRALREFYFCPSPFIVTPQFWKLYAFFAPHHAMSHRAPCLANFALEFIFSGGNFLQHHFSVAQPRFIFEFFPEIHLAF